MLMAPHVWGGPIITAAAVQIDANIPNFLIQESIYKSRDFFDKIVKELSYSTETVVCPIVREKDGLAMSSRNEYLSPSERNSAPILYKSLQMAESMVELGERKTAVIIKEIKRKFKEENVEVDYIEVVAADTLQKIEKIEGKVLIAAAIFIGKTRLIDNVIVNIPVF